MQKVEQNRIKLLIYWTTGPAKGGRVMWIRYKTHAARLKRARLLVNKYAGRYNAAIIYDVPPGQTHGQEIERYNSHGNQVVELKNLEDADRI